jgi:hypothetical protein
MDISTTIQNKLPQLTLDVWRTLARALCEYAVGYDVGRNKIDPVYVEVTEGRDGPGPEQRKKYSSCGDLAHWLYKRLGIREQWINRSDDNVFGLWTPGANVSDLWGSSCPFDQVPPSGDPTWFPDAGDVLLIWNTGNDAHVMVSLGMKDGELVTANYGAGGMSASISPGSEMGSHKIEWRNGKPFYGTRQIQRWLPLSEAIKHITVKPDLTGLTLIGEIDDAIQLNWNKNAGQR